MKILVFDNYDSFTYNLVHAVANLSNAQVEVFRNDEISLEKVNEYDRIILSPGPGLPSESGILLDLIKTYAPSKPILGVCLGHQAIGEAFGGKLINLPKVFHGVATPISIIDSFDKIYLDLPQRQNVGRYHSWVIDENSFPDSLKVTAIDEDGRIMSLSHKTYNLKGVQFHPESILTEYGNQILKNWLENC